MTRATRRRGGPVTIAATALTDPRTTVTRGRNRAVRTATAARAARRCPGGVAHRAGRGRHAGGAGHPVVLQGGLRGRPGGPDETARSRARLGRGRVAAGGGGGHRDVTVTQLDGLVAGRSAFHHSMELPLRRRDRSGPAGRRPPGPDRSRRRSGRSIEWWNADRPATSPSELGDRHADGGPHRRPQPPGRDRSRARRACRSRLSRGRREGDRQRRGIVARCPPPSAPSTPSAGTVRPSQPRGRRRHGVQRAAVRARPGCGPG